MASWCMQVVDLKTKRNYLPQIFFKPNPAMKKKISVSLLLLMGVFIISSAFKSKEKPEEMEKIMKKMFIYIKKEKQQIENNQPALNFPTGIEKVSAAKIHRGKKISDKHQQYINDFFKELNDYQQVKDSAERKPAFNSMVNSCISCHRHECPGPINAIEKYLF